MVFDISCELFFSLSELGLVKSADISGTYLRKLSSRQAAVA